MQLCQMNVVPLLSKPFVNWAILIEQNLPLKKWANPFMESFRDGIIPARAAKPQVQELKIHHESQKAYPNSPRMA